MPKGKGDIETSPWRSPDGVHNAGALRAHYAEVFDAFAEVDALGHRILKRASDAGVVQGVDRIVGLALLRRSVTAFVGIRHLLEASSVQPALVVTRSFFEVFLSLRYLVHGGKRRLWLQTPSHVRQREARARYFMASSIRTGIYRRQAMLDGAAGAMKARSANRAALEEEVRRERQRLYRHFRPQQARFGDLRCEKTDLTKRRYYDTREWYSFGFPKTDVNSVRALAKRFGWEGEYFLIYSPLSDLGHARGIDYDITIEGTQAGIHSPYDPTAFSLIAFWTCSWQMLGLAYAAKAYCSTAHADLQATDKKVRPALAVVEQEAVHTTLG